MTTLGSSKISASSEANRERIRRRAWLVALWLYAIAAAADFALHLNEDYRTEPDWLTPANLTVAFSASLFWPVDLIAQALLTR